MQVPVFIYTLLLIMLFNKLRFIEVHPTQMLSKSILYKWFKNDEYLVPCLRKQYYSSSCLHKKYPCTRYILDMIHELDMVFAASCEKLKSRPKRRCIDWMRALDGSSELNSTITDGLNLSPTLSAHNVELGHDFSNRQV